MGRAYSRLCSAFAVPWGSLWNWLPLLPYIGIAIAAFVGLGGIVEGSSAYIPNDMEKAARSEDAAVSVFRIAQIGLLLHFPWLLTDLGHQRTPIGRALLVVFVWWPLMNSILPLAIVIGVLRYAAGARALDEFAVLTAFALALVPSLVFWGAWLFGGTRR